MSAQLPSSPAGEYLDEQLIDCLALQREQMQHLTQYSHWIRLQVTEIKSNVDCLTNTVVALQRRQQSQFLSPVQTHLHPSQPLFNPSLFLRPTLQPPPLAYRPEPLTTVPPPPPPPLSFSTRIDEEPSRSAPFQFDMITSSATTDHLADDDADDYVPTSNFKPIVHLLPVETKTGEENEDILFCERAKLYRFDTSTNEMKERGIGEMKILQHKSTHLCRVLMRREHVLKVCANHRITTQMKLKPHQGKENVYVWSAMDSADGDPKHETLCVKFKTDEQAMAFRKVFEEAKAINGKQTDALPSLEKIRLTDDDVTIIDELKPTKEQVDRATCLQLPPTFYLYENKEPCKGCRGCREDLASILFNELTLTDGLTSQHATALLENLANFPSGFFQNSSLPSLMSMLPSYYADESDSYPIPNMYSPPKDRRMIIKAKRSLPSNRVPPPATVSSRLSTDVQTSPATEEPAVVQAQQKKSRNFSGNTSQSYSLENYVSQLTKNVLDRAKQDLGKPLQIVTKPEDPAATSHSDTAKPSTLPTSSIALFGNLVPIKPDSRGFSFTSFDKSPNTSASGFQFSTPTSSATSNTSSLFPFGNKSSVSFAQVVTQSSDSSWTSKDADERVFPGQGSLVFGAEPAENTDDADEPYEPAGNFKPIVHLLPVETKTGEEDEDILFCERAKLYRFDTSTNEMKERGIGEMKILQHKSTHLCRVLMRREQVLKVCANHRITPQMELKEHQGKENAYIWSAMDNADGTAKHETFCVRFKSADQAKRFFRQFNDAKEINANNQQ